MVDERRINPMNHNEPHPALAGLLRMLPYDRAPISADEKDKFVQLFRTVLDYVYPNQPETVTTINCHGCGQAILVGQLHRCTGSLQGRV
jgi:hypothetical protein